MQYIGSELQDRMNLLGIDISTLSEITFIDEEVISGIINCGIVYAVKACRCALTFSSQF